MSDYPELRKLQDIIDNQADRILDLEAVLRLALPLAEAAAAFDPEPWTGTAQQLVQQIRAALAGSQDK